MVSTAAGQLIDAVEQAQEAPYETRHNVFSEALVRARDLYNQTTWSHIVFAPRHNTSYEQLLMVVFSIMNDMKTLEKDLRVVSLPSGYGPRVNRIYQQASMVQRVLEDAEVYPMPRRRIRDDDRS